MMKDHLYTRHPTYTGYGCAMCGLELKFHQNTLEMMMKDGQRVPVPGGTICLLPVQDVVSPVASAQPEPAFAVDSSTM